MRGPKTITLLSLAIASFAALVGSCAAPSIHGSEDSIRASLLKRTPVGTPRAAVEAYLNKRGWDYRSSPSYTRPIFGADSQPRLDVRESISAKLGDYREGMLYAPLTDVWATWLIGTNSQLVDVRVLKYTRAGF